MQKFSSLLYIHPAASRKNKRGFGTTVREVSGWIVPRAATAEDILSQTVADLCKEDQPTEFILDLVQKTQGTNKAVDDAHKEGTRKDA